MAGVKVHETLSLPLSLSHSLSLTSVMMWAKQKNNNLGSSKVTVEGLLHKHLIVLKANVNHKDAKVLQE